MSESTPALEFTGERFTPECVREIWYEHYHRYAFAQPIARGRRVLDAACGEGYGSALVASAAASVLGLDVSGQAIAHARARYVQPKLRFDQADVTALDHLPAASFDLILSFETLEHLHAQETMLQGFRRLLAPGGLLLVSTPDKRNYTDIPQFHNEHHVRELYREEFESLLAGIFPHRRLFAQKLLFQSSLWALDVEEGRPAARRCTTSPPARWSRCRYCLPCISSAMRKRVSMPITTMRSARTWRLGIASSNSRLSSRRRALSLPRCAAETDAR